MVLLADALAEETESLLLYAIDISHNMKKRKDAEYKHMGLTINFNPEPTIALIGDGDYMAFWSSWLEGAFSENLVNIVLPPVRSVVGDFWKKKFDFLFDAALGTPEDQWSLQVQMSACVAVISFFGGEHCKAKSEELRKILADPEVIGAFITDADATFDDVANNFMCSKCTDLMHNILMTDDFVTAQPFVKSDSSVPASTVLYFTKLLRDVEVSMGFLAWLATSVTSPPSGADGGAKTMPNVATLYAKIAAKLVDRFRNWSAQLAVMNNKVGVVQLGLISLADVDLGMRNILKSLPLVVDECQAPRERGYHAFPI